MPIPYKLDYVIDQLRIQANDPRRALRAYTSVRFSQTEAKNAWQRIAEHKWYVSERLGRDVGTHVAAVDYFENIYQPPEKRHGLVVGHWLGQAGTANRLAA